MYTIPLQTSDDHAEILDVVDKLRAEGLSQLVGLPQLLMCGDQSSGKSSLLQAISGLDFPAKDNVCTRFATELILRRSTEAKVQISIFPDQTRPASEQRDLEGFQPSSTSLDQFADIVGSTAARLEVDRKGYSKDVLRVEVSGPTQPHLTLVDLPGLYHAPDEFQDDKGVDIVESLVLSYMRNERSVILAVVSAKSDIALQKITRLTREVDPKGIRTMGIITKPDTLPAGSDMERSFLSLATNQRIQLKLGWHVVKNRSYEERDFDDTERDQSEQNFLSRGSWAQLPRTQCGIAGLRPRLSNVLRDHILSELPSLLQEAKIQLNEAETSLMKLGAPRKTLTEQRQYMHKCSDRFTILIQYAIQGVYLDPFFGDAMEDNSYRQQLRAIMQNRLLKFAEDMETFGAQEQIVDDSKQLDAVRREVHRSAYQKRVIERMQRSRGRELPGTFNPLIICELFFLQSRPWKDIAKCCTDDLLQAVQFTLSAVLDEIVDGRGAEKISKHILDPALEQMEKKLHKDIQKVLQPHEAGHAITYNPNLIKAVQLARDRRYRASVSVRLQSFFRHQHPFDGTEKQSWTFRMPDLLNAITTQTEGDMEHFASSEAIDFMQAYYKVARERFVDDFSTLALEDTLLTPLLGIFTSTVVADLTDNVVRDIAAESDVTLQERERLTSKLAILQTGVAQLQSLDRRTLTLTGKMDIAAPDAGDLESNNTVEDDRRLESSIGERNGIVPQDIPELTIPPENVRVEISDGELSNQIDNSPKVKKKRHKLPQLDVWERQGGV